MGVFENGGKPGKPANMSISSQDMMISHKIWRYPISDKPNSRGRSLSQSWKLTELIAGHVGVFENWGISQKMAFLTRENDEPWNFGVPDSQTDP